MKKPQPHSDGGPRREGRRRLDVASGHAAARDGRGHLAAAAGDMLATRTTAARARVGTSAAAAPSPGPAPFWYI